MKFHVKKNDEVIIIAGDDKGKKGRIIEVDRQKSRVIVDGANLNSKHTKKSRSAATVAASFTASLRVGE